MDIDVVGGWARGVTEEITSWIRDVGERDGESEEEEEGEGEKIKLRTWFEIRSKSALDILEALRFANPLSLCLSWLS